MLSVYRRHKYLHVAEGEDSSDDRLPTAAIVQSHRWVPRESTKSWAIDDEVQFSTDRRPGRALLRRPAASRRRSTVSWRDECDSMLPLPLICRPSHRQPPFRLEISAAITELRRLGWGCDLQRKTSVSYRRTWVCASFVRYVPYTSKEDENGF